MYLPEQVHTVIDRLCGAGHEAFAVGGCVRDALLGRTPGDYDVTTSARPEEIEAVFAREKLIETGLRHGTVTVLLGGMPIEVTTYRVDGEYADHRHPDCVRFTRDLTEDLARRDFTINALAFSPERGIIDPFGGREDLAAGRIRCVGRADARFREDALRILRALRFSSVLGFPLDGETARAALASRELLRAVSAERVYAELVKLLCGPNVREVVCRYVDILGVVIPELLPMKGFDQRNPHHVYDVLEHSAAACAAVPSEPVLRLAALLHDIGKPECFTLGEDGVGHFCGHAAISASRAEEILTRLKSDRATRERVVTLVREHDLIIPAQERAVKRALRRLGKEDFFALLALKRADNLAQSPAYADRQRTYDALEELARCVLEEEACLSLRDLAVSGQDLIALGMEPGPALGAALAAMLDAVIDGEVPNGKDALLAWYRERA